MAQWTPLSPWMGSTRIGAGGGRDGLAHRVEIAVRHVAEALHCGREAFLHFRLSRGGDARERASVERAERGEDFKLAVVRAAQSREFVKRLVGFRAAVAEKNFAAAARERDEFFGKQSLAARCNINWKRA